MVFSTVQNPPNDETGDITLKKKTIKYRTNRFSFPYQLNIDFYNV